MITDERKGVYGGQTIQIIPHVTNEIKRSISRNADTGADVCLVEIGGTVGDIDTTGNRPTVCCSLVIFYTTVRAMICRKNTIQNR